MCCWWSTGTCGTHLAVWAIISYTIKATIAAAPSGAMDGWLPWGPFHFRVFPSELQFDKFSFCSDPNSYTIIATSFCTWHGSCAVLPCVKSCSMLGQYSNCSSVSFSSNLKYLQKGTDEMGICIFYFLAYGITIVLMIWFLSTLPYSYLNYFWSKCIEMCSFQTTLLTII